MLLTVIVRVVDFATAVPIFVVTEDEVINKSMPVCLFPDLLCFVYSDILSCVKLTVQVQREYFQRDELNVYDSH